jgi:RNA recognition motif-containing protein
MRFENSLLYASFKVEICKPLNDPDKGRPWSKYSKKTDVNNNPAKKINAKNPKQEEKEDKKSKKEKRLEKLLGDLNEDEQFKEFLAANKAIKSKENIWKNDIDLGLNTEISNTKRNYDSEKSRDSNSELEDSGEDDDEHVNKQKEIEKKKQNKSNESLPKEDNKEESKNREIDDDDDENFENGRMFIRNLCYTCKEEDLEKLFAPYAPLVEVNIPIDNFSKKPKGFAYVTCMFPEKAIKAFNDLDGTIFQGRMLHIIPAKSKREDVEDENAHKTFKNKKDEELKKKSQSSHNWNSLFINQNSVANLMASRYNVDKSELFDVHSTKNNSIAVKLAVGETQIVNDIRSFLIRNGVKLDAFNSTNTERSKTVILIKNLPNNTTESDLREAMIKFKVNGTIKRFVMPEYGIAALIEFNERQEARDAFKKMAYRKFKSLPLYLEWAPIDVFDVDPEEKAKAENEERVKFMQQSSVYFY